MTLVTVVAQQEHRGVDVGWPTGALGEIRAQHLQGTAGIRVRVAERAKPTR